MIVVDSNVIAYCWIRGGKTDVAQGVRLRDPAWHVPVLWRSELRSALAGYLWRNALELDHAVAIMAAAESALGGCEHLVSSDAVLQLAATTRLSSYDCEFVVLARSLAVPLVTEDRAVLKAFPEVAVSMERFLAGFPPAPPAAHQKRRGYGTVPSTRKARRGRAPARSAGA